MFESLREWGDVRSYRALHDLTYLKVPYLRVLLPKKALGLIADARLYI